MDLRAGVPRVSGLRSHPNETPSASVQVSRAGVFRVTHLCPAVDVSLSDGERTTVNALPPGPGRELPYPVADDALEQNGNGTQGPASGSRNGPITPGPRRRPDPPATCARAVLHAGGGVRAASDPASEHRRRRSGWARSPRRDRLARERRETVGVRSGP